ncbi:cohesin domain-containing protein [Dehalococcoidia bacterium]|nr:cohesin domain-containing protein [Dehalococcoidia bacterium]
MKKLRISMGIVLAGLMLCTLLPAGAALATDEPCPEHRIWVEPATQTVAPGDTFTVTLMQDSPAGTAGAEVGEFRFDHTLLEILEVTMGAGYTGGMIMPPDIPGAIKEANEDGSLDAFACFFIPPGKCEPGEQEFLVITMRAKEGIVGTHTVPLTLHDLYMGGPPPGYGDITPTGTDGEVVVEAPPAPARPRRHRRLYGMGKGRRDLHRYLHHKQLGDPGR